MSEADRIVEAANSRKKRMNRFGDRAVLLERRTRRGHKKRHSVNREKSYEASRKHRLSVHKRKERDKRFAEFKRQVAAYWRGDIDEHP